MSGCSPLKLTAKFLMSQKHSGYFCSSVIKIIVCRYLEVLLRRVTCNVGQIIYSPNQKAFVSLSVEGQQVPFAAEEYADLIG